MNLGQIATIVGQRLGVSTAAGTNDGSMVRAMLNVRHDQIFRSWLWKDSIIQLTLPINPTTPYVPGANYMPTKGRVILPPIFQMVLGVNFGRHSLDVQRPMIYYRADYNRFLKSGFTKEFSILSSCVWEFDTPQPLYLSNTNTSDSASVCTADLLQSDEISVTRTNPVLNTLTSLGTSDRIDNLIIPVLPSSTSAAPGTVTLNVNPLNGSEIVTGCGSADANGTWIQTGSIHGFPAYTLLGNPVFNAAQAANLQSTYPQMFSALGSRWYITDSTGDLYIALSAPATPDLVTNWQVGTGVAPTPTISPVTNQYSIVTLGASQQSAPKCQRIQLTGIPTASYQQNANLDILGKRNTPPFSADTDTPAINGLDGILMALVYYDFKSRDEAGGTPDATSALNEAVGPNFLTSGKAGGFLAKLMEEEVIQAAYNCRIIPSEGFGGCDYYHEPFGSKANGYSGW